MLWESAINAISEVEGVDGVFFGPVDLSASMGFLGKAGAEPVRTAIQDGITHWSVI
jgi:4-hydroxy-2-oxoheptanedioate aldolase